MPGPFIHVHGADPQLYEGEWRMGGGQMRQRPHLGHGVFTDLDGETHIRGSALSIPYCNSLLLLPCSNALSGNCCGAITHPPSIGAAEWEGATPVKGSGAWKVDAGLVYDGDFGREGGRGRIRSDGLDGEAHVFTGEWRGGAPQNGTGELRLGNLLLEGYWEDGKRHFAGRFYEDQERLRFFYVNAVMFAEEARRRAREDAELDNIQVRERSS